MSRKRILVWTDSAGLHAPERPIAYKEGIHEAVAGLLNASGQFEAVPFAETEECFAPDSLDTYRAIVMWAHGRPLSLETQGTIVRQVESGKAGIVGLHSVLICTRYPILVPRLFGQTARYGWEDGVAMRYTAARKDHPITEGMGSFELTDEAYYEPLGLVEGAEVILTMEVPSCETRTSHVYNFQTGRFDTKEFRVAGLVSRAAWTYEIGLGRAFYFQPGHETEPTYRNPLVQGLITRAVAWVAT